MVIVLDKGNKGEEQLFESAGPDNRKTAMNKTIRSFSIVTFLTVTLAGGSQVAYAGGTLAFVSGKVTLVDSKGQSRAVREKERVETGDTLITGEDGEAHIITDDHGAIGLRPKSKLRIDEHVAEGNRNDRFIMTLYSGFMRSISGWISKTAPRNFEIRAANATVGIRGTDQEVGIVETGSDPGVYNKVNSGGSVLRNAAGETPVNPGQAARSPAGLPAAPKVLPAIPAVFKATRNEKRIDETKTRLELEVGEKLKAKQDEAKRTNPARAACLGEGGPRDQLDAFIRAYESGNLAQLREMIDTRMPGYQRVLDDLVNDFNRQKQIRLLVRDVNIQCGPDVASIQFSWEKRFLDVSKLTPGLFSGRSSMLMQRGTNMWHVSALSGDNPFGSTLGVLARLSFGPAFALENISRAPKMVPVNIEVTDADRAGEKKITAEIFSSAGDLETVQLNEVSPGRFVLATLNVSTDPAASNNGVVSVVNNGTLTLRYLDPNPGANQPATTLTKVLQLAGGASSGTDTTPDPFSFAPVNNAPPSALVTSAAVVISGINAPASLSIAGGQYSINGGAFTSAAGTITNGQNVVVRVTAPATSGSSTVATLTVGSVAGSFMVSTMGTAGTDTTPDPFTFAMVSDVMPGAVVTSSAVVISGINAPAPLSIAGGQYSINGGGFTSAAGTITNGQSVVVQLTAPAMAGASAMATLTVGGVAGTFTVSTASGDAVPGAFTLGSTTTTQTNQIMYSPTVTITGINTTAPITISGSGTARYSINGGGYTNMPGTINPNDQVKVRVNSSATVGGITTATLNIGGVTSTFKVTVLADTTPNSFTFTSPMVPVGAGLIQTSNTVTITGINTTVPISVSGSPGAAYTIDGGINWTMMAGTIPNNTMVQVRVTSSATEAGTATATLNVGGVTSTFTVTTADQSPNGFTFTPATVTATSIMGNVESNAVMIQGINTATPLISNGSAGHGFSINNGLWTTMGNINPGDSVKVRVPAPGAIGAPANMVTLTIGQAPSTPQSATFTVNAVPVDGMPDQFMFTPSQVTGAIQSTQHTSNAVPLSGFNVPVPISVNCPLCAPPAEFSINGLVGPFITAPTMVNSGAQVAVRLNASSVEDGSTITATLNVGGTMAQFAVTTRDIVPNAFLFPLVTTTAANCYTAGYQYETIPVTITGLTAPSPVTITLVGGPSAVNPDFRIAGGAYVTSGNITNGQTITARFPTVGFPTPAAGSQRATVTIGGVSSPVNQFCP